jgi:hypothetical protein
MLLLLACATPANPDLEDTQVAEVEVEPYACGWNKGDPGDLESTGSDLGDVVADLSGVDQCGEEYHLWDGYGTHTVLLAPAFW